jgi:hypothetical protein
MRGPRDTVRTDFKWPLAKLVVDFGIGAAVEEVVRRWLKDLTGIVRRQGVTKSCRPPQRRVESKKGAIMPVQPTYEEGEWRVLPIAHDHILDCECGSLHAGQGEAHILRLCGAVNAYDDLHVVLLAEAGYRPEGVPSPATPAAPADRDA